MSYTSACELYATYSHIQSLLMVTSPLDRLPGGSKCMKCDLFCACYALEDNKLGIKKDPMYP